MDHRPKFKTKNLLEVRRRQSLWSRVRQKFLRDDTKSIIHTHKKKLINWTWWKLKTFCCVENCYRKKDKQLNEREYLQIIYLTNKLYPNNIKNSWNSAIRRQTKPSNGVKNWKVTFTKKGDPQITNKYMKRYSTSSIVLREVRIKTTIRSHCIPVRMTQNWTMKVTLPFIKCLHVPLTVSVLYIN